MKSKLFIRRFLMLVIMCLCVAPLEISLAHATTIVYEGTSHVVDHDDITIEVEGQEVTYEGMFPVIVDGRTLVPVREVLENPAIGATVTWVQAQQEIIVEKAGSKVELFIGMETAYVNGERQSLDRAPVLMHQEGQLTSKTMVPLRFITEALGYEVEWVAGSSTIKLSGKNPITDLPVIGPLDEEAIKDISDEKDEVLETKTEVADQIIAGDQIKKTAGFEFADYEDSFNNSSTLINAVDYNKYQDLYSIHTESEMSSIKYFIWGGKLVVTISNASIGHIEQEVDVEMNAYVTAVRSSQFSYEPLEARVVFDLLDGVQPTNVVINESRTQIDVLFGNDGLKAIALGQTEKGDYLDIDGNYSDITMFRLENPDRIVVDLENTLNPFGKYEDKTYDGKKVSGFRIDQFNETTTRLVFETKGPTGYEIQKLESGMTRIFIGDVDQPTDVIVPLENLPDMLYIKDASLHASTTYSIDYSYHEKIAIITLDTQIKSDSAKEAEIKEKENIVSVTSVSNKIYVKTKHIYDLQVVIDEGILTIQGARPWEIHQNIVVIDPGHGGYKPGAIVGDVYEKTLNLIVTESLRKNVASSETIKYYFTRQSDLHVSLQERVEIANDIKADLFISVHCNSLDIERYAYQRTINGLEVHVTDTKEQSGLENELGETILTNLKASDVTIRAKSVKVYNELYVLKNTYMPSVLIECGYMTNVDDFAFLTDPEKMSQVAKVIQTSVEDFFQ